MRRTRWAEIDLYDAGIRDDCGREDAAAATDTEVGDDAMLE